jgi:predicted enzyme related to lactoylglutathione lyase
MTTGVSGVLFAGDARRLARFYVVVFGASVLAEDDQHALLDVGSFRLIVHQIPPHAAKDVATHSPPLRRESAAMRLDYAVDDLVKARISARQLGGQVDEQPPEWAGPQSRFFLGFDCEGNVFGVADARA